MGAVLTHGPLDLRPGRGITQASYPTTIDPFYPKEGGWINWGPILFSQRSNGGRIGDQRGVDKMGVAGRAGWVTLTTAHRASLDKRTVLL